MSLDIADSRTHAGQVTYAGHAVGNRFKDYR